MFGSKKKLEHEASHKLEALTAAAQRLGVDSVHDLPDEVKKEHDYDGLNRAVVKLFGAPPRRR